MATPPFRRVLVANRGEIAIRICRGLVELGIEPVSIYSDTDRDAAHVLAAPIGHPLGGETAADSYLRIDKVIDAARATDCDAVHPGYGFLSENADFARAVVTAGMTFIGPGPEAMEILGSKQHARAAAEAAGVPTVPGFHGDDGDDARLLAEADRLGFPLLVKAAAGGGGKGMRLVDDPAQLPDAVVAARREARAAFGDDCMVLEKRVQPARHVEIQILGDASGAAISLHERECSVQRRHQKILEESPSPAVDTALRKTMGEAAVRLARSVGYRNAGTVEFLLDEDGQFYFLEVNTRLQVEHPVTELVTGLDLVHLQVRLAAGASLRDLIGDRDLQPRGHAIEARIYAEDPEHGFLPAAGLLQRVVEPEGPGIRVDSGVHSGTIVSPHYDPMLAKLIVHAPDRATACQRLRCALEELVYLGIPTNIDFLHRVVSDPDFRAGNLRTDMLERKPELCAADPTPPPTAAYAIAAIAQALGGGSIAERGSRSTGAASPWHTLGPLRLWETA